MHFDSVQCTELKKNECLLVFCSKLVVFLLWVIHLCVLDFSFLFCKIQKYMIFRFPYSFFFLFKKIFIGV